MNNKDVFFFTHHYQRPFLLFVGTVQANAGEEKSSDGKNIHGTYAWEQVLYLPGKKREPWQHNEWMDGWIYR